MRHGEIDYRYRKAFELLINERPIDAVRELRLAIKATDDYPEIEGQKPTMHYCISGIYKMADMPEQRITELEKIVDQFGDIAAEGRNAQREIRSIKEELSKRK